MSRITITISGHGQKWQFSNDWDECDANGWLHIEDFAGWYGGVDASVTPETKRFQSHGNFPAPTIRGPRKMDLVLTWHQDLANTDHDYQTIGRIASGIMWDKGPYEFSLTETASVGSQTYTTAVQLDGEIQHAPIVQGSEQAFRVKIPIRANDPFLYAPPKEYTVLTQGTYQGLRYPLAGQGMKNAQGKNILSFGAAARQKPATITNLGNARAYPVFTVYADAPDGVRITAGNETFDYRGPLFSQVPLVVDMSGTVTMRDKDVTHNVRKREWLDLRPGGSMTPRLSFPGGGTGFATCVVRDTYL